MKLKSPLFSTTYSSRPVKAKSVEFMLRKSIRNTLRKYVLHFEESFRNLNLARTSHHTKRYSRKMHESLAFQATLRYQHKKQKQKQKHLRSGILNN